MQLKELTLNDKELFNKYSPKTGVTSQFAGFVNLFLYSVGEKIKYFFKDDKLIVTGINSEDNKRYFMFPDANSINREDILYLKDNFKEEWGIYGLSKEEAEHIKSECEDLIEITHLRDMDNYIYLSDDLINLSGRKFHSKKNHVNSFKKSYTYEYIPYSSEHLRAVKDFLGKWYIEKEENETLFKETNSIMTAIDNYRELGLKGGLIKVQDKVVAFSMGEQMTDDMAVIHFEKADTEYNGAYAVINNEFVKNEWSHLKYINREEDMGLEGLRKSKLSYKPVIIFEVYKATLK